MIYIILPETDFVIKQTLDLLGNWVTNTPVRMRVCARVYTHTHTHTHTHNSLILKSLESYRNFSLKQHSRRIALFPKMPNGTVLCCVPQSCLTFSDPMDCSPPVSSIHWDSPGKNTGVDCLALLQGIFPSQGSNPGLPHCRRILYQLSYKNSTVRL